LSHQNEEQVKLRVRRLRPDAVLPRRATPGSVGYDLFLPSTVHDVTLHGQRPEQFHLGIAVTIPEGCYGRIAHAQVWRRKA
jgi:dUTP pyrophosphatase